MFVCRADPDDPAAHGHTSRGGSPHRLRGADPARTPATQPARRAPDIIIDARSDWTGRVGISRRATRMDAEPRPPTANREGALGNLG
jgi:hypothetical protein